ncbi:Retrovirus-related Pol polyprotein from transposon TNT 1-94 [Cucumis melo var. makuwa]|uniref:Retrovirus-related Pol polyprotein from transposon TNT 1-94 n=1 Tax=Cucumis melo var. makuwa TaxID=1194695 RepID=A0A5A7VIN9_CUCMM|nr:Retrovirus-related Pol polyprotein from transposon TNT 1-94 [Cucumis melo var. makuwa]TYK07204.1 Retrovirus-related Pol polyprotein from transposon TNT 1-94 [Cucumis melo var. makuwa]
MSQVKSISSPLPNLFKLISKQGPSTDKEKEDISKILYTSVVGSLMYDIVCIRPDTAHDIGIVSCFMSNLGKQHWEAKCNMRYLRGTSSLKLTFGDGKPILAEYINSDMARDLDSKKSASSYLMTFASGAVSWQLMLQKCVALSITEVEYIAAAEACKEMLWIKRFIPKLGFKQQRYVIYYDNQSTIDHLGKNATFHSITKHIDVRYHWLRDALNDELFELEKIYTDHNWI